MEDKDIQQLFRNYQPELSSDQQFMSSLIASMEKVEFIKRQQETARRQNRIAVAVAAVTGFLSGVVFMLLMPYISAYLDLFAGQISAALRFADILSGPVPALSWIIAGMTTVFLSISSYYAALSVQKSSF